MEIPTGQLVLARQSLGPHIINDIITAQRQNEGGGIKKASVKKGNKEIFGKQLEMRQRDIFFLERKRVEFTSSLGASQGDVFPLFWVAGPSFILNWSPRLFPTALYTLVAPP